jgi:GT2 family glycosyltransferase
MATASSRAEDGPVGAVIVTHQSAAHIERCVSSLIAHAGGAELRIVVCDAGSTDGIEEVATQLPVRFLPGPNRGFAAGVNRALADPTLASSRWILMVNPDVTLTAGSLSSVVSRCDAWPQLGVATVRTLDEHGELVYNLGRPVSLRRWTAAALRGVPPDWFTDSERYAAEATAGWVAGAFLLLRREVLERVGGFDERFFLYSEEVDLCERARRAGWQVGYLPSATVVHALAKRRFDAHRTRLLAWSRVVYLEKWYGRWAGLALRIARAAFLARQVVRRGRRGAATDEERTELVATLRFPRDRYGPAPPSATEGRSG